MQSKQKQAVQKANTHRMAQHLVQRMLHAKKWKELPKGWTDESFKKFWKTISEKSKHPVTVCIEKMKDKMDDPGAFCAAAKDRAEGGDTSWRGQKKASDKALAMQRLKEYLQSWGFRDVSVRNSGGARVDVSYAHSFSDALRAHQFLFRELKKLGIKMRNSDFGPGDMARVDLSALMGMGRQAKVDPEKQCKLLMRNFRTMINAALKKGGNGGMTELGAIGDGLNWIKNIKSADKAEDYLARAAESFKGIRSSDAFLKAVRELVAAAKKVPPKRYPSMGQTAINNALYDLSDAFVSMVMAKNRAQRALSEPDNYDSNLKQSYQNAQQRLNGFVSRHLLQSATESSKKPKPKAPAKPEPKPAPELGTAPDPASKPKSSPKPSPEPEPEMDSFGLSGRYKDRAEQGNPKAINPGKKKSHYRPYWGG